MACSKPLLPIIALGSGGCFAGCRRMPLKAKDACQGTVCAHTPGAALTAALHISRAALATSQHPSKGLQIIKSPGNKSPAIKMFSSQQSQESASKSKLSNSDVTLYMFALCPVHQYKCSRFPFTAVHTVDFLPSPGAENRLPPSPLIRLSLHGSMIQHAVDHA